MSSQILWIVGVVAVVFAAALAIFLPIARRNRTAGTPLRSNTRSAVSGKRLRQLAVGAILAEAWHAYTDSLETGLKVPALRAMLAADWRITDPAGARRVLRALLDAGHRTDLTRAMIVYASRPKEEWDTALQEGGLPPEQFRPALDGLDAVFRELEAKQALTRDDLNRTLGAWDYGRAAAIARAAYDAGFLLEREAWRFLAEAGTLAQFEYGGWRDFAASYLIGRALWAGAKGAEQTLMFAGIVEDLSTAEGSPWGKVEWID